MKHKEKMPLRYTNHILKNLLIFLLFFSVSSLFSQENVIDKIVAIVDENVVLKSDIENELLRAQTKNIVSMKGDIEGEILENLLIVKLMVAQAKIDSIPFTEAELEGELSRRIETFISQAGSREQLEQYFDKSIKEIKDDFRDPLREYMLTQKLQSDIVKDVKTTPSEVRKLVKSFPTDSLPIIPTKLQIQQIVLFPEISDNERNRIQEKLRDIRQRIQTGESFAKMAILYSEDPGSAQRGGELGYVSRASLVENFANVAFNLQSEKISKIVETEYGFHIMQLIDRKGDKVNVRHILIKPKIEEPAKKITIQRLDSIANFVRNKTYTFENAAMLFSEDKFTKNNGGMLYHPATGMLFEKSQLPPDISQQLAKLQLNEISKPFEAEVNAKTGFKIIRIKKEVPEHKANLNDDWKIFEELLLNQKKQKVLDEWIGEKLQHTYVKIDENYKGHKFRYKWF